jgi:long-chain acyl-CoA synthetase
VSADTPSDIQALPKTIAQLPFFVRGRFPRPDLVGRCDGGRVVTTSGSELVDQVRDLSLGLAGLGLTRGTHVAILAESRPDWLISDLAILTAGAVTVPIYPTLPPEQVAFILRDAGAMLAIASTELQCRKILAVASAVPSLRAIVVLDPVAIDARETPVPVLTAGEVAAAGHKRMTDGWGVAREFQEAAAAVGPSDVATIIYTSGTTGDPKGVMLTHGNIVANLEGVAAVIPLSPDDTALSYLPLCHSFERTVSYVYLVNGVSMVFAESIETLARDLRLVRPTVMTGVPRVFEKLHARILAKGQEADGLRRRVFAWAAGVAERLGRALSGGGRPAGLLAIEGRLADRLVFQKIRDGLGGRLRLAVSGSAPLRSEIGTFFLGLGLPIIEGYGLTETAPVLTVMPLDDIRFGTVGRPLPGVEIRTAGDGEILARGPNVMLGYYNRPADTYAALAGGWFHTGDIGAIDADGYLTITDRKKELIVTSGGKKIAPRPIEEALRAHDFVAEAVLVGERRHFPSALIVADVDVLARRLSLARPADRPAVEALLQRAEVLVLVQTAIDELNLGLAQFERIKRFSLLPAAFSIETGELTPTLKVKRRVVEEQYRALIDALYAEGRVRT